MKWILFNLIILFLHAVMIPVYLYRHYKRMRFRANLRGARAAYNYAKWIEDNSIVKGAKVKLHTSVGLLVYSRPLTIKKLMAAYRDR